MTTVDEICRGLPRSLLDSVVTDTHIADIASRIKNWRELAPYLDLSAVEEDDIVESNLNNPKVQRREALTQWKELNGTKATYWKLIIVFCCRGRAGLAGHVRTLLQRRKEFASEEDRHEQMIERYKAYLLDCYDPSMFPHPSSVQWPYSSHTEYVNLDLYDTPINCNTKENSFKPKCIPLKSLFAAGNSLKSCLLYTSDAADE